MKNRTHWLLQVQFLWLAIALAAVFGFRISLLPWRTAIMMVAAAVGGLVLTGFFSLLVLFMLLRAGRRGGGKHCLFSAVLSLPALISVLLMGMQGAKAPPIHDITTDTDNPPIFRAAQTLRLAGDNSIDYPGKTVADRQQQAYPDIKPIETPLVPIEAFAQSLGTAEKLRWRVIGQEREQGLIEAVDQTMLFGFTDDIIIRIAPSGNGSRIDLRSASRAGTSDLGVNAERIRDFRRTFNSIQTKK
jgi:uncharacterized protein (DUF1499 family)